eukprot:112678-Hanusia_phi.AAC.1
MEVGTASEKGRSQSMAAWREGSGASILVALRGGSRNRRGPGRCRGVSRGNHGWGGLLLLLPTRLPSSTSPWKDEQIFFRLGDAFTTEDVSLG